MSNKTEKQITRKDFLKGMGVSVAGVAMAGSVGALLTGCTTSADTSVSTEKPQWPFKYVKLDPEKVKSRSYNAYKEMGGWGIGVSEGFFGTLADEVGYPFNQIPVEAFIPAAGGYGLSTLCGSLGTAATCIGMVTDTDTAKKLIGELFKWYKGHDFPQYQPENLNLTHTVADSVLCADSVGKFMKAEGVKYDDPKRKARCAGVAGEVTAKMVELLNETLA